MWPRSIEKDVVLYLSTTFLRSFPFPLALQPPPPLPSRHPPHPNRAGMERSFEGRAIIGREMPVDRLSSRYCQEDSTGHRRAGSFGPISRRCRSQKASQSNIHGIVPPRRHRTRTSSHSQGERKRSSLYALCSLSFLILSVCMEAELHSTLRYKITLDICVLGCVFCVCVVLCVLFLCFFFVCVSFVPVCCLFLCVFFVCVLIGCLCV